MRPIWIYPTPYEPRKMAFWYILFSATVYTQKWRTWQSERLGRVPDQTSYTTDFHFSWWNWRLVHYRRSHFATYWGAQYLFPRILVLILFSYVVSTLTNFCFFHLSTQRQQQRWNKLFYNQGNIFWNSLLLADWWEFGETTLLLLATNCFEV